MNGHFETNGLYPLSTEPVEGYLGDKAERTGTTVIAHINGKFLQLNDSEQGYTFVESRDGATKFENHSTASLAAGKLLDAARAKYAQKQAA